MEYVQDLEICNSTIIVSGLFAMTLLYNCLSRNAKKARSLEIEMTDTDQAVIPVENVETQTSPIEDEDKMYTDQMRNYMKRYTKDMLDVKVEIDPNRRKMSV